MFADAILTGLADRSEQNSIVSGNFEFLNQTTSTKASSDAGRINQHNSRPEAAAENQESSTTGDTSTDDDIDKLLKKYLDGAAHECKSARESEFYQRLICKHEPEEIELYRLLWRSEENAKYFWYKQKQKVIDAINQPGRTAASLQKDNDEKSFPLKM